MPELKFKGDKPYSGTITLTKDKKVIIEKLVSKNKKWCAIKEANEKMQNYLGINENYSFTSKIFICFQNLFTHFSK